MDAESRVCKRCRIEKSVEEYRDNRHLCKACERKRSKVLWSTPEGFFRYVLRSSQTNANSRGLSHDLKVDDIRELYTEQEGRCAVTKLPLTTEIADRVDGRRDTNLSLDRIDPLQGYTKENVVLVCQVVNLMRQQLSYGDLRFWCELIIEGEIPIEKRKE